MLASISRRVRENQSGFTLIELLVVVAIIALLATFAVPRLFEAINKSKSAPGAADMNTISSALERHYMDVHAYPHAATANATTIKDALRGDYVRATTSFTNGFNKGYVYITNATGTYYILLDPANYGSTFNVTCGTVTASVAIPTEAFQHIVTSTTPTKLELQACTVPAAAATAGVRFITN